jgi:formamidopyrimidine-DNA glycosylase
MAELPELLILARQMDQELEGREFDSAELLQEKCLNLNPDDFISKIIGKTVIRVYNKGKWIFIQLSDDYHLLLNLGMGADIFFHKPDQELPEDYQCLFNFADGSSFSSRFWWVGRAELIQNQELAHHKATKDLAISPLDGEFTTEYLREICGSRSQIKNLLLNQRKIGGIGNVYIHDILFRAGIHPKRLANTLESCKIDNLYVIIRENLNDALTQGGLVYEKDFYGEEKGFDREYFLVAYKEGDACPVCGTTIEKIKTGSTSSYICPSCQKL